jgi:hypothetical protein
MAGFSYVNCIIFGVYKPRFLAVSLYKNMPPHLPSFSPSALDTRHLPSIGLTYISPKWWLPPEPLRFLGLWHNNSG